MKEKFIYEYFFVKGYHFFSNELDKFSRNYFHTQTKFDQKFIREYENAFSKIYNQNYRDLAKHNYWLSKFFVMENSIYLTHQINFWENIYRFTKSLSAAFFLVFIYCSVSFMLQYELISRIILESSTYFRMRDFKVSEWLGYDNIVFILFLIPLTYFIIKALIVRYYLYVYDNRFNRMILRSFVSSVAIKEYNKKSLEVLKS
ncbi:MAG TPA: hypothetical protein PL089_12785 [Ignavibacteria bacterium]|nr:hypothetical protein [Ignavibacteria bacterium]